MIPWWIAKGCDTQSRVPDSSENPKTHFGNHLEQRNKGHIGGLMLCGPGFAVLLTMRSACLFFKNEHGSGPFLLFLWVRYPSKGKPCLPHLV